MTKRVHCLDFIRAVTIFLIIIYHYNGHALQFQVTNGPLFWYSGINKPLNINYGFMSMVGVSLFVILSGASLMLSTKESLEAKTFFKRRFLSIYPLFWTTYAVAFVALLSFRPPFNVHWGTFLLTVMGLDGFLLYKIPNFYILGEWFLGLILIFYVFFPLLRYLFLKNPSITIYGCFLLTLGIQEFYFLEMPLIRFPLARSLEFVLGMSFAYFFIPIRKKSSNIIWVGVAVLSFLLINQAKLPLLITMATEAFCVFIFLAYAYSLFDRDAFRKFLHFLSIYSFGAFLTHHVIIVEVLRRFHGQTLSVLQNYLLSAGILLASYFLSFVLTNATSFIIDKITLRATPTVIRC